MICLGRNVLFLCHKKFSFPENNRKCSSELRKQENPESDGLFKEIQPPSQKTATPDKS